MCFHRLKLQSMQTEQNCCGLKACKEIKKYQTIRKKVHRCVTGNSGNGVSSDYVNLSFINELLKKYP
jgi:hypothetical protein